MANDFKMAAWQATLLITNSTTALSLNFLMYYFVYRNSSLRTPFNTTILNACLADILVSINMFVATIYTLSKPSKLADNIFCNMTGFVTLLSFVASVMGLAAVSLNRYFLVCRWKMYTTVFTKLGTATYIAATWVFSLLISIPPLFGWGRFAFDAGQSICFVDWSWSISYMIFMISVCFFGPLSVTLVSLYFILKVKRETNYRVDSHKSDAELGEIALARRLERRRKTDKEERKITISIAIVAAVFLIAWGPFVLVMFVKTIGKIAVPGWIDFGVLLLGCLNSTANPIVYMTLNVNYRKEVIRLVSVCGSGKSNPESNSDIRTGTSIGTPASTPRLLRCVATKEKTQSINSQ